MNSSQALKDQYDTLSSFKHIDEVVPEWITDNLNSSFPLRPYQKEAILRFIYYVEKHPNRPLPTWLLFQMATGSGKTLIMASLILYLYSKGYRNFIFFVNSNNIIEKTKDNFLNNESTKYLFSQEIKFNERHIKVKEVEEFQSANSENINILFTTIQGLHYNLNFPIENFITFDDFKDKNIVMLSDEAHHINSLTKKKLNKEDEENFSSWEHTITRIALSNRLNVLLEFTATIDMNNDSIKRKYHDKLIYEYSLKQFRLDGYSKEVNVLTSDLDQNERALQALILSQYRKKVAERNNMALKPVVLFKSKKISDSKDFEQKFFKFLNDLKGDQISKILSETSSNVLRKVKDFLVRENISFDNLAVELREEFSPSRCISINSKEEVEASQITVNSLEHKENTIRAIFAVNMLNEGWDVLNLFDIVRLYTTRDARAGVPGQTTIAEAQLIGRGARYFPFSISDAGDKFKRKFDNDADNELKILEDFYYHSKTDSKYIDELRTALVSTGIIPPEAKEISVKVKDSIKKTEFWRDGVLFLNKKVPNLKKESSNLSGMSVQKSFNFRLYTGITSEIEIFGPRVELDTSTESKSFKFSEIPIKIVLKAMSMLNFYQFTNLAKYFPSLKRAKDFITNDGFLKDFAIDISGTNSQLENISRKDLLNAVLYTLIDLSSSLRRISTDYIGTDEFTPIYLKNIVKDKTLHIAIDEATSQERGRSMKDTSSQELKLNLTSNDWYIYDDNYGTSEEKFFIKFLDSTMSRLKGKFTEVYLLRNENLFQIYRFSDGSAFEPDFVLFLKEKEDSELESYQLFIEPKGGHLLEHDKWKEEFLKLIKEKYKISETVYTNDNYKLIGLPFFNESKKNEFISAFENSIGLNGSVII